VCYLYEIIILVTLMTAIACRDLFTRIYLYMICYLFIKNYGNISLIYIIFRIESFCFILSKEVIKVFLKKVFKKMLSNNVKFVALCVTIFYVLYCYSYALHIVQ
jgi:hypothetical protein